MKNNSLIKDSVNVASSISSFESIPTCVSKNKLKRKNKKGNKIMKEYFSKMFVEEFLEEYLVSYAKAGANRLTKSNMAERWRRGLKKALEDNNTAAANRFKDLLAHWGGI